jgi:hypothetical protein
MEVGDAGPIAEANNQSGHQCSETVLTEIPSSSVSVGCTPGAETPAQCGGKQSVDPLDQWDCVRNGDCRTSTMTCLINNLILIFEMYIFMLHGHVSLIHKLYTTGWGSKCLIFFGHNCIGSRTVPMCQCCHCLPVKIFFLLYMFIQILI